MHPEGFKPFTDTLKSPANIALFVLGAALLVDYFTGSRVMGVLVRYQLSLFGTKTSGDAMQLLTMFGTFTRVSVWTRFLSRILIVTFFALPGLSCLWGLKVAVRGS